jgi:hypothetical protein
MNALVERLRHTDRACLLKAGTYVLGTWTCCLVAFVGYVGNTSTTGFFVVGITGGNSFMGIAVDNYRTYAAIMAYVVLNTLAAIVSTQVLLPFYSNDVQDILHSNVMPFRRRQRAWVYIIISVQSAYTLLTQFMQVYILLTQLDFFVVGSACYVLFQTFTTVAYMQNNTYADDVV